MKPSAAPLSEATLFSISDKTLKNVFYGSLVAMLLIFWFSGYNVGFHQDEIDMNNYGKANIAYYATGGRDTSFMGSTAVDAPVDHLLKYYGSAYEYLAVGLNKIFHLENGPQEFNTRHAINQVFAIIALLFAGLTARKIAGWQAAIFTSWLLFLTPAFFGAGLFNTKDMPFCAGYIASVYFIIAFLQQLPSPSWKTILWLILSFAFTINTRIGGLLLFMYLFLFLGIYLLSNKALLKESLVNYKSIALKLCAIVFGSMALVIITWPFLLKSPFTNLVATMNVVKKFPVKIKVNFEGAVTDSLHLPAHYLPKFMFITIPVFILVAIVIGVIAWYSRRKSLDMRLGLLLLVSTLFPVIYAIASHVALYSAWRHFLFIYPGLCIIAGIGLATTLLWVKKPALQVAVIAACILGLAGPITWSIKNHPYEYTYFNELSGGFKKAFYEYETDYWQITLKNEVEWMMKHEPILQSADTVVIASNAHIFVRYYIQAHYPKAKVRVFKSGYTDRNSTFWHYAIFHPIFLEPNYLESAYPPINVAHSANIDDIPVALVLADTSRLDFSGIQELLVGNYKLADSFFTEYFKTSDVNSITNIGLYPYLSIIKGYQMKTDEAMAYANKCFDYYLPPGIIYYAYCGLAISNANKANFKESFRDCNEAIRLVPPLVMAKDIQKQVNQFVKLGQVPVSTK